MSAILTAVLAYLLPKETPVDKDGKIDYVGAALGLGSLIVFNVVWKYVIHPPTSCPSRVSY